MKDYRPFNIPQPPPFDAANNFIEINAKLIIFDHPRREIAFGSVGSTFLPVATHLKWQAVKEIEAVIEIKYNIEVTENDFTEGHGNYKISAKWAVSYEEKGIKLETIDITTLEQKGKGEFAIHAELKLLQPKLEADIANTLFYLTLTGGYTDEGVTVGVGPVQGNIGGSKGTYTKTYQFMVSQVAVGRPEEPIQLPEGLLSYDVLFERENQDQISPDRYDKLRTQWVTPLFTESKKLALAIKHGECMIWLEGHASVTGRSKEYNLALSEKRITSVARALAKIFDTKTLAYTKSC